MSVPTIEALERLRTGEKNRVHLEGGHDSFRKMLIATGVCDPKTYANYKEAVERPGDSPPGPP